MAAENYGRFYWCVKTPLSNNVEVYAFADEVVIEDGALLLVSYRKEDDGSLRRQINIAFAPGKWFGMFAASCIDGHAVAAEHWDGEVAR